MNASVFCTECRNCDFWTNPDISATYHCEKKNTDIFIKTIARKLNTKEIVSITLTDRRFRKSKPEKKHKKRKHRKGTYRLTPVRRRRRESFLDRLSKRSDSKKRSSKSGYAEYSPEHKSVIGTPDVLTGGMEYRKDKKTEHYDRDNRVP